MKYYTVFVGGKGEDSFDKIMELEMGYAQKSNLCRIHVSDDCSVNDGQRANLLQGIGPARE
ncbi:hypothetical protein D3C76_1099570 [compost metagenome]